MQKGVQLQVGFVPSPPDQGIGPWTQLGALPPDPRYMFTLRVHHVDANSGPGSASAQYLSSSSSWNSSAVIT